jgi:hypothetical protein
MGYISTEEVKAVRNEIKKVLTSKDGFKISVKRSHYSEIVITVMQSPLVLISDKSQINHYYLDRIECKNTRTVFELIDKARVRAAGESINRNAGDPGADYADCNYYVSYRIGEWDRPCVFVNN